MKFVHSCTHDHAKEWDIITDAGVDIGTLRSEVYDANDRGSTRTREWRVDGYEVEIYCGDKSITRYFRVSTWGTPAKAREAAKEYARDWEEA